MKKLFLTFAACLMALSVSAAAPNIYASGLTAGELADDGTLEITYFLNTAATDLEFQVLNASGIAVRTYKISGEGLLTAGAHTTTIDLSDCPAGTFTWGIKASAAANTTFAKGFESTKILNRLHATIDNNPESPYFGRIYAENRSGSGSGSLYAWNADYTVLGENFMGGQTKWQSAGRPSVDAEGYVWLADYGDGHGGVYIMNPVGNDPSQWKSINFFEGGSQLTSGENAGLWTNSAGVGMGSSSAGNAIYGSGENTKLYLTNEDAGGGLLKNSLNVYNIGTASGNLHNWSTAPTHNYAIPSNGGGNFALAATSHGVFVGQNRVSDDNPLTLQFIANDGSCTYKTDGSKVATNGEGMIACPGGGVAVSADELQLAIINGGSKIMIYDIAWDGDVPTLTLNTSYNCGFVALGTLHYDYAGNLVASAGTAYGTSMRLVVFALPKADNSCLTPAQAKYGFTIAPKLGEVIATSISIEEGTSIDLIKGNTMQLHANVRPMGYTSTISWSSDAEGIATVSADGLVTGVAAGTATIKAIIDAQVATLTVTVKKPNMAGGTYTVGGAGADFASLYEACQKVNESNITGDITLAICANLTEPKNMGLINTSAHTITIRPDGETLRTITFTKSGSNKLTGSLVIGAADPEGSTTTTATQHVVIDGCAKGSNNPTLAIVHNNLGGSLRIVAGSSNNAIKNLHVSYGKNSSGTRYPIWSQGDDLTLIGCTIIGNGANRLVQLETKKDVLIEDNTFEMSGLTPASLAYGIHAGGAVTSTIILRGNKFLKVTTDVNAATAANAANRTGCGIAAVSCQGGTWIIENNYFAGMDFLNKTAGATARMEYIRTIIKATTIRHNTFYIPSFTNKPANTDTNIAAIESTSFDGVVVSNNLFISAEETSQHTFLNRHKDITITSSNNVFYHTTNAKAYIENTTAWDTYSAKDATAKWAEVTFTNAAAGDLSLAAPSDRDVRLAVPAIAAVKTDINGTPRHAGSVYAGAWEGPGFKLIVDSDASLSDLISDGMNTCEAIVTDGATLTCDAARTVASMRVEDGAKLVVDNATLAITGTFTAHSQNDVQPQILTKGTGAITYDTFQFLKCIPADRYYFFSLPFECATSSVTVDDGVAAKYNTDWNIRYYDGAGFAANPSNKSFWLVDNTGKIQPNQGYTIGVATAQPGQYRELAFTTSTAVDFSLATSKTIAVAANGATGTEGEKYKGWSFVMNPYTSNINGTNDNLVISSNAVAYVTIPDPGQNKTYTSKRFSSAGDLPPFFGFFVQVAEAGNVVFTPGTPAPKEAPARRANGTEIIAEPLFVGVRLSNGVKADETSLVIGEQFTEAYEIGSDLMKMIGYADKPQLYTFDAETKYAFHSLNETAATAIHPLGVYLPAESEYTFSLMPIEGEREVQAVYLYDYETNACVDLMQEDYTFTSGTLNSEKRFALSPQLAPKATTAIDLNTAADLTVWQSGALQVCIEGATAGDRVRIFDIQGRLVSEWTATETSSVGNVPASGMYVVECTGATGVQVVKLMINH